MKTTLSTLALIATFSFTFAQNYTVNTSKSSVKWHAEKVTGEHDGNVNVKSGSLNMTKGKLSGGSFEIDMTSITCSDIEDAEWNAKLVGHLKSDDFFSVENHKSAKMLITSVKHISGDNYSVVGKMTIKNITKEVKFEAIANEKNGVVTGVADITIDRTQFDIRYGSGSFFDDLGDKTIYDEFTLKVNIVADTKNEKA